MKYCIKCKLFKDYFNFCKNKQTKDGYAVYCKMCFSLIKKKSDKKYAKSQKGKKTRAKAVKKYCSKPEVRERRNKLRREKWRAREIIQKNLRKTFDPFFKLSLNIRNRVRTAIKIKQWKKTTKYYEYIGCSREQLISHLECKFTPGMCWNNYGKWHIDHIIPISSAKTEDELYKLCHYTNLQPLWAKENLSKGDKIEQAS